MITFVCCSVRPEMASALNDNINKTVGVPYELIVFDNRKTGYGICKVYNDGAQKAQYDYLCFLHEDVKFNTLNWGAEVIEKLNEPSCGAIGFAGSTVKLDLMSGWGCVVNSCRENLIQHSKRRGVKRHFRNPNQDKFAQVITLDGLCIFVHKNVWRECKFDDKLFTKFHCYDIDFALTVAQKYNNYICYTLEIEHFSEGSYNKQWVEETIKLHDKWCERLPMGTSEWNKIRKEEMIHAEYHANRWTMKHISNLVSPADTALRFFKKYWNKSHYAWLIPVKLVTDRITNKRHINV